MKYWDTSAILPLLVRETTSAALTKVHTADPAVVAWWGTPIECTSAFCRLQREDRLTREGLNDALRSLAELAASWTEVTSFEAVREKAKRLLRVHVLRAADAVQLAAAIVAADGDPARLPMVCKDTRLAEAADREGFEVIS